MDYYALVTVLVQILLTNVDCYSNGPPNSVCGSMAPDTAGYAHNSLPQSGASPYSIEVLNGVSTYTPGIPVTGEYRYI